MRHVTSTLVAGFSGVCVSLTLAACGLGSSGSATTPTDEPIDILVGEQFAIRLEANPTTGYVWQLAEPLDETLLEQVSNEFEPQSEGDAALGAPGVEIWTFKGLSAGETVLSFEYTRPWDDQATPADSREYHVLVND